MKKAILIYNPASGDHKVVNKLDHIFKRFQECDILLQPYRMFDDAKDKLQEVLESNDFDFAVVSGGDGTLNRVANIILKNNLDIPVGIIPSGTCNDFARSLNIPSSLNECLDIILGGTLLGVDAGLINDDKYFLSTCAGGFFVDASFNTHSELKKNFGPFAYYLKALSDVKNIKSFKIKIKTEKETIEEKVLLFLILNGKDAAGFSNLIKEADISDGIMDIVLIKNCSHIDLASLFFKVLSNESLNDKNVTKLQANSCIIKSSRDVVLSIDGEEGGGLPISVKFINKVFKVFVR